MIRALAWLLLAIALAAPSAHAQPADTGAPGYETVRRGRGASGGEYLETYGCMPSRLWPGIERGIEDLDAVLDFVRRQSWADPSRLVMGGQSRGGILSVAYAGRRPDVLKGVVNFAGGWTGEGCDQHRSFNAQVFRGAGGDGHRLGDKPGVWTATADEYLRERGLLPNAGR